MAGCSKRAVRRKRVPSAQIARAARVLREGGLVVMPTETVYGLAADAFNREAVRRIFALKGRPAHDPLIVHIADMAQLARVAGRVPAAVRRLAGAFWPGPLTLVLPKRAAVPGEVTAGLATVAVRMPSHAAARRLLRAFGGPLAAPSANRFGRISPTSAAAVRREFGRATPLVLDAGPAIHGLESTIVRPVRGGVEILRHGAVTAEQIARVASGRVRARGRVASARPEAPGMLKKHYAPARPLRLLDPDWRQHPPRLGPRDALLLFRDRLPGFSGIACVLSPRGSVREAARNLYRLMRRLDDMAPRAIYAELLPERGLGAAINDRLRRAAHRRRS